jgi:hypothetical protein
LYRFINSKQIIDQPFGINHLAAFLVEDHGVTSLRPLHRFNCSYFTDCIALARQKYITRYIFSSLPLILVEL